MQTINAFEARTHFGELLDRVERGESVAVYRKGKHVATLMPVESTTDKAQAAAARIMARREKAMGEGRGLSIAQILEGKNEGRK